MLGQFQLHALTENMIAILHRLRCSEFLWFCTVGYLGMQRVDLETYTILNVEMPHIVLYAWWYSIIVILPLKL